MKAIREYSSWSLRQFYLLYFCPTQFRAQFESPEVPDGPLLRLVATGRELAKLLPWVLAAVFVLEGVGGLLIESASLPYDWNLTWRQAQVGVPVACVYGVALGVASRIGFGVSLGVALSVALGTRADMWYGLGTILGGSPLPIVLGFGAVLGVAVGVAFSGVGGVRGALICAGVEALALGSVGSVSFGAALGVALGVRLGIAFSVSLGLAIGTLLGVAIGVVFGATLGMMGGEFAPVPFVPILVSGRDLGILFACAFFIAFVATLFRLIEYPLAWVQTQRLLLAVRRERLQAPQAWKVCPVRWIELIWLPLWDTAELLELLTRHDRTAGLDAIAFVARERPLQRSVATRAVERVLVGDLQAESLAQIAAVSERMEWIVSAALLSETPACRRVEPFRTVARRVAQGLGLDGARRRADALTAALKQLEQLQLSLVGSSDALTRQLLQVAGQWRELIVPAERDARSAAAAADELPNPFIAGRPLGLGDEGESVFIGRRDLVRRAEALLLNSRQPPTLLLQGPRRMGKSSILRQLPRLLGPALLPVTVDCQDPALGESLTAALRYLSRCICAVQSRVAEPVRPLEREQLEHDPFSRFGEWLDRFEELLAPDARLLVCLDEYERLAELFARVGDDRLLDWLRHRTQHDMRFCLLFSGVRTFSEMGPAWTGRFPNAYRVPVGHLSRDEATQLLTRPVEDFSLAYGGRSLEIILDATAGQPYLTQAAAFELVLILNDEHRKLALDADSEAALRAVFISGDSYFFNYWTDMGSDGRALVFALARGETPPVSPRAERWLREHLVLDQSRRFVTPLFGQWVREYAPEPDVPSALPGVSGPLATPTMDLDP